MQGLLPDIRELSFTFFSRTVHRRGFIGLVKPSSCWQFRLHDSIPATLWPPNSPDLNPVDYKIWSIMQEKVYQSRIEDVDELRERIKAAWEELDQRIIDTAVRQWRTRLHAWVKAKADHLEELEHKLPWQNDEMPDILFNRNILKVVVSRFLNFWANASLAILRTTYMTELNSSRTVLVSSVTEMSKNNSCIRSSISWYTSSWNYIQFCCLQMPFVYKELWVIRKFFIQCTGPWIYTCRKSNIELIIRDTQYSRTRNWGIHTKVQIKDLIKSFWYKELVTRL